LGDGGKSILGSIAEGMTMKSLATAAGRLLLGASPFLIPIAALVGGIASQQAIKEDIESNPNDPKYDNNPYANSIRDNSTVGAAAKKLKDRSIKHMRYPDVVRILEANPESLVEDSGMPLPELQKWVSDNKANENKAVLTFTPKSERLKAEAKAKQTGETAVPVPAVAEKPVDTAAKVIANVNEKVISNAPTGSQSNTPTATSVPTANEAPTTNKEEVSSDSLSNTSPAVNVPTENNTGSEVAAATQLNQDLSSTNNSGAIVADNSQKITIVNQNNDGLLVEELTGVRLDESTFKKVARQNLHMI
jgi:hypothetical protein